MCWFQANLVCSWVAEDGNPHQTALLPSPVMISVSKVTRPPAPTWKIWGPTLVGSAYEAISNSLTTGVTFLSQIDVWWLWPQLLHNSFNLLKGSVTLLWTFETSNKFNLIAVTHPHIFPTVLMGMCREAKRHFSISSCLVCRVVFPSFRSTVCSGIRVVSGLAVQHLRTPRVHCLPKF